MVAVYLKPKALSLTGPLGLALLLAVFLSIWGAVAPATSVAQPGKSHKGCFTCHNGSVAGAPNIVTDFAKASRHPYDPNDSAQTCGRCHNSDGVEDPSGAFYPKLLEAR